MTASSPYKELFRLPSLNDKLALFRALFDTQELNVDMALALLKVLHQQLSREQATDRSAYKRYAEAIASLRYHKADMLRQVVNAWNADRIIKDPQWLSDGVVK